MGESSRVCQQNLADGKICGLPICNKSPIRCEAHAHAVTGGYLSDKECVREYIEKSTRDYVDLTGMRIRGMSLDTSLFLKARSTLFIGTEFVDCAFFGTNLENADFSQCKLIDTSFTFTHFTGSRCSFERADLRSREHLFSHCMFGLSAGKKGKPATLDFRDSRMETKRDFFSNCYAQTVVLMFDRSVLNGDTLALFVYKEENDIQWSIGLSVNGANRISFDSLRFDGRFIYTQSPVLGCYSPMLNLSGINFSEMSSALFVDAMLTPASFKRSTIEAVRFLNPVWSSVEQPSVLNNDGSFTGKSTPSLSDLREESRLYVQLKKGYEAAGNYIDAERWYYCEMETRRKVEAVSTNRLWRWLKQSVLSPYPWYKLVSDYGGSYMKAALWILVVFLASSLVYYFRGGVFADEPSSNPIANALIYSLSVMTLQFSRMYSNISTTTYLISIGQLLLTAILVPLFLLALRRKFRR